MERNPSLVSVRDMLTAHAPGIVIRKTAGESEYRVTFSQAAIAAAYPAMTRGELIDKAESLASYESDIVAAYETGKAMYRAGLAADVPPANLVAIDERPAIAPAVDPVPAESVSLVTDSGLFDMTAELRAGERETVSATRRDNVEYHKGRAAAQAGDSVNPYPGNPAPDSRFARWSLGYQEAMADKAAKEAATGCIDMTPTWAAILPVLILSLERGDAKGRKIARDELARMAALADERNIMAATLAAKESGK